MKKITTQGHRGLSSAIFALLPVCLGLAAEPYDTNSAAVVVQSPAPVVSAAPAKLPYGVEDILKLSRAQISDDIILNYVRGSGTIYNLGPKDIVYLRDQGVSEKVIGTMLDQRKRAEVASQGQPAAPVIQTAHVAESAAAVQSTAAAGYADPNATYAEAPLTPPASSVYVIPYSGAYTYPYPSYYGYGYPYYYRGWYGPSFAFRFGGHGFGFHGGYGGFHGGHGGFHGGHGGHR